MNEEKLRAIAQLSKRRRKSASVALENKTAPKVIISAAARLYEPSMNDRYQLRFQIAAG